jgi:hypothetical protein
MSSRNTFLLRIYNPAEGRISHISDAARRVNNPVILCTFNVASLPRFLFTHHGIEVFVSYIFER